MLIKGMSNISLSQHVNAVILFLKIQISLWKMQVHLPYFLTGHPEELGGNSSNESWAIHTHPGLSC